MIKKTTLAVAILILLGIFLRILALGNPTYTDEVIYQWSSIDISKNGFNFLIQDSKFNFQWTQPPLTPLLYRLFAFIFGISAIKVLPFIFSLFSILLIYLIAKKIYGEKTAALSALIMSLSFWHILASQMVDTDGSIMLFFYLLSAFFYLKYEEKGKEKSSYLWLMAAGIIIGLALLTKYSAAIFAIILSLYIILMKKLKSIKILATIGVSGAIVFSIFPLLCLIFNSKYFLFTIAYTSSKIALLSPRIFIYLLIWATPLLFGTFLFSLLKFRKKDLLFTLWAICPVLLFMFSNPTNALSRYAMIVIPALVILSAKTIAEIEFKKKEKIIFLASFFAFLFLLYLLNLKTLYIEHNLSSYVSNALKFRWNFFFPITEPSGPTFGLTFSSIAISIIFSGVFLVLGAIYYLMKKRTFKIFFAIFIAVSFAFNILLAQEFVFHTFHPNIPKVTKEVISYYNENKLGGKIATNTYALSFYLNKKMENLTMIGYGFTDEKMWGGFPKEFKGYVLIVDFPIISRQSSIWKEINTCKQTKVFYSKGRETGYVYRCN